MGKLGRIKHSSSLWKSVLEELLKGPFVSDASYRFSLQKMFGDVMIKYKNDVPAFIFDVTINVHVLDKGGSAIAKSTISHMSGDSCSVEFKSTRGVDWDPVITKQIKQDMIARMSLFEDRLKEHFCTESQV